MNNKVIQELMCIVKSVELNKKYYKGYEFSEKVVKRCEDFCKLHNINITHGSAYRELKHKSYYYKDKYVINLLDKGTDLYELRKTGAITDKEIVDKLLKEGD